jgi:hypothetical protein
MRKKNKETDREKLKKHNEKTKTDGERKRNKEKREKVIAECDRQKYAQKQ